MKVFNFVRYDYCNQCNTDRSIECYDSYGKPVNYSLLVDQYLKEKDIDRVLNGYRTFIYFRCKKCGALYRLDWRTRFPVPLRSEFVVENFIEKLSSK